MVNNSRNSFILVACLCISSHSYPGRWVNWDPIVADLSHGINTVVESVGNVKNYFVKNEKKEVPSESDDEIEEEEIPTTRHMPMVGIDTIKVSGSGSLLITQDTSKAEEFVIECIQADMPNLDVRIDDNTLVVTLKETHSFWSKEQIVYRLNIATLSKIDVADSVSVEISNINVPALLVRASGASKVSGSVSANELTVDSSDEGGITLIGCVNTQTVRISGSGTFDGRNLDGKSIEVDGSGNAYLYCNVSDVVAGSISGSGSLMYAGSPVVDVDSSKKASVKKL